MLAVDTVPTERRRSDGSTFAVLVVIPVCICPASQIIGIPEYSASLLGFAGSLELPVLTAVVASGQPPGLPLSWNALTQAGDSNSPLHASLPATSILVDALYSRSSALASLERCRAVLHIYCSIWELISSSFSCTLCRNSSFSWHKVSSIRLLDSYASSI